MTAGNNARATSLTKTDALALCHLLQQLIDASLEDYESHLMSHRMLIARLCPFCGMAWDEFDVVRIRRSMLYYIGLRTTVTYWLGED